MRNRNVLHGRRSLFNHNQLQRNGRQMEWKVKRDKSFDWRARLHSVFVGNLHRDTTLGMLWKVFSDFGVMVDAYIPPKQFSYSARSRTIFAFVRYRKAEEASKAVNEGNGKCTLNHPMIVRKASHGKIVRRGDVVNFEARGNHSRGVNNLQTSSRSFRDVVIGKPADLGRRNSDTIEEGQLQYRNKKTKDTVEDSVTGETRKSIFSSSPIKESLDVTIPPHVMDWLQKSAVGRLRNVVYYKVIQDSLLQQGIGVTLSPLCDNKILITFLSLEDMQTLLKDYVDMFETWFECIKPWVDEEYDRQHKVWVKMEDVPLMLWHDNFFKKIADGWGKVIQIAEITNTKKSLEAAWMMIEVNNRADIPVIITGKTRGISFKISMSIVSYDTIPKVIPEFIKETSSESSSGESSMSASSPGDSPISIEPRLH